MRSIVVVSVELQQSFMVQRTLGIACNGSNNTINETMYLYTAEYS